ncbi:HYC_CC_PP family protein [Flavitalea antarctica]
MKQVIVIALMLVYLIASTGISGSMHYCGGYLASISFDYDNTNKCACGDEEMKNDCCQDKAFYLHIDSGYQKARQLSLDFYNGFNFQPDLFAVSHFPFYEASSALVKRRICRHLPSGVIPPLYILNQVFRI